MLKLLQRPTSVIDPDGNLVGTAEMLLQMYIITAQAWRNAHSMVLNSELWGATDEARGFWAGQALRWRESTHYWRGRYRAAIHRDVLTRCEALHVK